MTEIKIDLHTHSEGSYDGKEPVELMVQHGEDIDIDGFAVTDHDEIEESLKAFEIAENYDTIVLPGEEVSTSDGHLLAIGVEEKIEPGRPFQETVEDIRDKGGAAVVPHPFQKTRHGVSKRKIEDVDAVEAYNAWIFTGFQNHRARKFADNRGFPKVAGSDAHSLGLIGRAYAKIHIDKPREEVGPDDIKEALRNGDVEMEGSRAPIHRAAYHYVKASIRKTAWLTSAFLEDLIPELKRYSEPLIQAYRKDFLN
jgi:predicted metal-dependent phosphoesterase TrpH